MTAPDNHPSAPPQPLGRRPSDPRGRRDGRALRQPYNPVHVALLARGEPMVWLTGAGLVLCIGMILALLGWICVQGAATFWPREIRQVQLSDGSSILGEFTRTEIPGNVQGTSGAPARTLYRTGDLVRSGPSYRWVSASETPEVSVPRWAVTVERYGGSDVFGVPIRYAERRPGPPWDPLPGWRIDPKDVGDELQRAPANGREGSQPMVLARTEQGAGATWRLFSTVADLGPENRLLGVVDVWDGPEAAWSRFESRRAHLAALRERILQVETDELAVISSTMERARLQFRDAALCSDPPTPAPWLRGWENLLAGIKSGLREQDLAQLRQELAAIEREFGPPTEEVRTAGKEAIRITQDARAQQGDVLAELAALRLRSQADLLFLEVPGQGAAQALQGIDIVRGFPANQLNFGQKVGIYLSRWWEFLSTGPREANTEGGVLPAIFGTVLMTLLMCLAVVPLGVLAALYLREYARQGVWISAIRIAVNNLAGVPSIVFGVFGLGFFCYILGAGIDDLLYSARLPSPTFGKGGLLWASLTLALMTLPVVIVATEEALAAVPNSMREGSYACGASKWQTIRRIVLPRALPGILTGAILAMARGAGEVAPLMLVGAVKLAPALPLEGSIPFGLDRSFMHLGFHIFDLGFQSEDSEASRPMVYTTTLLLIGIIATLNITAIMLRNRLRKRFAIARL